MSGKISKLNDALSLVALVSVILAFVFSAIGNSLNPSTATQITLGLITIAVASGIGAAISERWAELE